MSVAEKITKIQNKEIIQPKKMGLLVENPVYKLDFLLINPSFLVELFLYFVF